jgi:ketosteroid isomerase-like protein
MDERDNVEIVHGIYSAFARGDMNSVLAPFADSLEFSTDRPTKPSTRLPHGVATLA